MVNKIKNRDLKYIAEDLCCESKLWAIKGYELIRDSRGVAIGRMKGETEGKEFIPFI